VSARPKKAADGYTINMLGLRIIDAYFTHESTHFTKLFSATLKPVTCEKCDSEFETLSDLHHHLRGDTGYTPCSYSQIPCQRCHKLVMQNIITDGSCTTFCSSCLDITNILLSLVSIESNNLEPLI
jgi:hypothetical protein